MHYVLLPSAVRRVSKCATALWLTAIALPVFGPGCTTTAPIHKPAFACYDVFGRQAPTIVTKAECDSYTWQWR
jgi:hypothetical protein